MVWPRTTAVSGRGQSYHCGQQTSTVGVRNSCVDVTEPESAPSRAGRQRPGRRHGRGCRSQTCGRML